MDKPQQPETTFVTSDWVAVANVHRFAHQAMATTFEVIVQHEDKSYAQQAAQAAFAEVDRLEQDLSQFLENSDVARINHLPALRPLPLSLDTFECLKISAEISRETGGAFDVTVGFLVDCWRDEEKRLRTPTPQELQSARAHTGMHLIFLDEPTHAVALAVGPVQVDLGGIGKGYAVDKMAEMLREWSIERALIHGGFSSVRALDAPRDMKGWPATLSHPLNRRRILARLELEHIAVSGSGVEKGPHIIDPRRGEPVRGKIAAWSLASDAARADALSTAFMLLAPDEIASYCAGHPQVRALLIVQNDQAGAAERSLSLGPWREGELQK